MWGWKAVERTVEPSCTFDRAGELLQEQGFEIAVQNPSHAIFRKAGSELATSAEKLPLELALARSEAGLFFQLRYGCFVLFDTGDLEELADELAARFSLVPP